MTVIATRAAPIQLPRWREVVWPKEHGSWSLALEPVVFGLLAAPSLGGAALAVAAVAGFLARRPLRVALTDARAERRDAGRRAAVACGAMALSAWFGALVVGGIAWMSWLAPAAAAGAIFVFFDLQQEGREQHAEVAGAFTFACLPAAFAALGGWSPAEAAALATVMIARAVPTVLTIRGCIRARKNRTGPAFFPLVVAVVAAVVVAMLAYTGLAPRTAAVLCVLLAARAFVLLVAPRPVLRASTIGMIEAGFGVLYVVAVAIAWRL